MTTLPGAAALCLLLALPGAARADDEAPVPGGPGQATWAAPPDEPMDEQAYAAGPAEVAPDEVPYGEGLQPAPDSASSAPAGQWVQTQQYGWVWMPYADAYTSLPQGGVGEPYEYVYGPTFGWTWVVAPWIWGWGPWPVFGLVGPAHFGWYGHGWWRTPSRWHAGPGFRGGASFRGGTSFRGGASFRGGTSFRGGGELRGGTSHRGLGAGVGHGGFGGRAFAPRGGFAGPAAGAHGGGRGAGGSRGGGGSWAGHGGGHGHH